MGLTSLPSAFVMNESIDADLWRYRTYGERAYVDILCALLSKKLSRWEGRYVLHEDAIVCDRAILRAHFHYENRHSSNYWNIQPNWERRRLLALRMFMPYHFMCCFNITESARSRYFGFIPQDYQGLEVCYVFKFKQEPIFSYKSRAPI